MTDKKTLPESSTSDSSLTRRGFLGAGASTLAAGAVAGLAGCAKAGAPAGTARTGTAAIGTAATPVAYENEHMWAPFDSAVGKDIPYDPSITARRDGHLPEQPDFTTYVRW